MTFLSSIFLKVILFFLACDISFLMILIWLLRGVICFRSNCVRLLLGISLCERDMGTRTSWKMGFANCRISLDRLR